ncbi:MAG: hypothetical protein WAK06_07865 [Glutamicibacter protophormiae]
MNDESSSLVRVSAPTLRLACYRCNEEHLIFESHTGLRNAPSGTEHIFCSIFINSSPVAHDDFSLQSNHHAKIEASWQVGADRDEQRESRTQTEIKYSLALNRR